MESATAATDDSARARLAQVRERMAAAEQRAARPAGACRLVAVGKTFPASCLQKLARAGQRDFGENRVQEAVPKIESLAPEGLEWHLVGHLQSNKAGRAARLFHWIHSLDSPRLARRLSDAAVRTGRHLKVLVQVDLALEPTKSGVPEPELRPLLEQVSGLAGLELRGLMILPPLGPEPEASRPWFRKLAGLARAAAGVGLLPDPWDLSMGMSGDYEVAIEEGATLVRVGTALFGPRERVSG